MDEITFGRSLPYVALVPAVLLSAIAILFAMRRCRGPATRFVVFAIWLRFVLTAFHDVTFQPSPLGLSWNALGSISVVGIGLLVLRRRTVLDPALWPFYPVVLATLISGLANHVPAEMVDMAVKYVYLAVIGLATIDAIGEGGWEEALSRMLAPFLFLLGLQALSLLLGVSKQSEADGSASFIGGFNHEAAFSMAMTGGLLVILLRRRMAARYKLLLIPVLLVSFTLATYRTAIVGMVPLFAAAALVGAARSVVPSQRALVVGVAGLLVVAVGTAGFLAERERFGDLGVVLTEGTALIKPPRTFTIDDRHVMSGRALIWSRYLYGYADGTQMQKLVGQGPNSWEGVIPVYAHNTLISALYELGLFGVVATLFLWIAMFGMALFAAAEHRLLLVMAHLGFFILNMATMPLWMIEGLIFYGVLCGCTVSAFLARRRRPSAAPSAPGRLRLSAG
jgi:hypothetical protein